jgi:hypothetical protein
MFMVCGVNCAGALLDTGRTVTEDWHRGACATGLEEVACWPVLLPQAASASSRMNNIGTYL